MFGCKRKIKLNQLRRIRRLRDRVNAADNIGVARKLLFQCQDTREITITSGHILRTSVYIQMWDGWEKTVYDYSTLDAIKEANQVIYERLSEQYRNSFNH